MLGEDDRKGSGSPCRRSVRQLPKDPATEAEQNRRELSLQRKKSWTWTSVKKNVLHHCGSLDVMSQSYGFGVNGTAVIFCFLSAYTTEQTLEDISDSAVDP